jgi:16S rRNA processing protein RimM
MHNAPPGRSRRSAQGRFQTYTHRNRKVRVPTGHIAIGMITGAHGLRGELKVELHTDFPERFVPNMQVYLGEDLDPALITTARPHQGQMLVQFDEITDRDAAEELRGLWIFVPESEAIELEEDTYFIHDIVGLSVQTEDGNLLGTVEEVLATGANDVYVVKTPGVPPREILLPAIADVVKEVDLAAGVMTVTLLPGLVDDDPQRDTEDDIENDAENNTENEAGDEAR